MRGDSGDPRVARGVRVSSRPGCRCTRAPAVPTRPSRGRSAASDVGGGGEKCGEKPRGRGAGRVASVCLHLSRRVRAKLGAEERAGFESAGGGLLGGPEGGGEYK